MDPGTYTFTFDVPENECRGCYIPEDHPLVDNLKDKFPSIADPLAWARETARNRCNQGHNKRKRKT